MKVPEKIQIHLIKNDYDAWSVRGYSFLEDKQMGMTEYTRTDAFIEKAEKFFTEKFEVEDYNDNIDIDGSPIFNYGRFIDDFKNYIKGE
jgi:hypothetical protein